MCEDFKLKIVPTAPCWTCNKATPRTILNYKRPKGP